MSKRFAKYEVDFEGSFFVTVPIDDDVFQEKEEAKNAAVIVLETLLEEHQVFSMLKNVGFYCSTDNPVTESEKNGKN